MYPPTKPKAKNHYTQTQLVFGPPFQLSEGTLPRAPVRLAPVPRTLSAVRDHRQIYDSTLSDIRDHFQIQRSQFDRNADPVLRVRATGFDLPPCPSDGIAILQWRTDHLQPALPAHIRAVYKDPAFTQAQRKSVSAAISLYINELRAVRALENGIAEQRQAEKEKRPVLSEVAVATDIYSVRNTDGACKDVKRFMSDEVPQPDELDLIDGLALFAPSTPPAAPPLTVDPEETRHEEISELLKQLQAAGTDPTPAVAPAYLLAPAAAREVALADREVARPPEVTAILTSLEPIAFETPPTPVEQPQPPSKTDEPVVTEPMQPLVEDTVALASAGRISDMLRKAGEVTLDEISSELDRPMMAKEEEEEEDDQGDASGLEEDDSNDERELALIRVMAATENKRFKGMDVVERRKAMAEDAKEITSQSIRSMAKKDPRGIKLAKDIMSNARKAGVIPHEEEGSYHSSQDDDFSPNNSSEEEEEEEEEPKDEEEKGEKKKKKKGKRTTKERLEESVRDIIPRVDDVYSYLGTPHISTATTTKKRRRAASDPVAERDKEDLGCLSELFALMTEHLALKPNSRLARINTAPADAMFDEVDTRAWWIWHNFGFYKPHNDASNSLSLACYRYYARVKAIGTNGRMLRALDLLLDKSATIRFEPLEPAAQCTFLPGARATQLVHLPSDLSVPVSPPAARILEAFHFGTHFITIIEQQFSAFIAAHPTLPKASELAIQNFCNSPEAGEFARGWLEARHTLCD